MFPANKNVKIILFLISGAYLDFFLNKSDSDQLGK